MAKPVLSGFYPVKTSLNLNLSALIYFARELASLQANYTYQPQVDNKNNHMPS